MQGSGSQLPPGQPQEGLRGLPGLARGRQQLCHVYLVRSASPLALRCGAACQYGPARGEHRRQHRVTGQRMSPAQLVAGLDQQLCLDGGVSGVDDNRLGEPDHGSQHDVVEIASKDRGRLDDPALLGREARQSPPDKSGEGGWHRHRRIGCTPGPFRGANTGEQLLDKKGQALRPIDDKVPYLFRQRRPCVALLGQHAGLGRVQSGQPQHGHTIHPAQATQRPGQGLVVPHRGRNQHRPAGRHAGQVVHERQRLPIGPMQILKHE